MVIVDKPGQEPLVSDSMTSLAQAQRHAQRVVGRYSTVAVPNPARRTIYEGLDGTVRVKLLNPRGGHDWFTVTVSRGRDDDLR